MAVSNKKTTTPAKEANAVCCRGLTESFISLFSFSFSSVRLRLFDEPFLPGYGWSHAEPRAGHPALEEDYIEKSTEVPIKK